MNIRSNSPEARAARISEWRSLISWLEARPGPKNAGTFSNWLCLRGVLEKANWIDRQDDYWSAPGTDYPRYPIVIAAKMVAGASLQKELDEHWRLVKEGK